MVPLHGSAGLGRVSAYLNDDDLYLTRQEAADFLRVSNSTLERWAMIGKGPKVRRSGHKALYRLSDLRAFAASEAA